MTFKFDKEEKLRPKRTVVNIELKSEDYLELTNLSIKYNTSRAELARQMVKYVMEKERHEKT